MKDHLLSLKLKMICRMQVSKSALLTCQKVHMLTRVMIQHMRIFWNVVINGEIFLVPEYSIHLREGGSPWSPQVGITLWSFICHCDQSNLDSSNQETFAYTCIHVSISTTYRFFLLLTLIRLAVNC